MMRPALIICAAIAALLALAPARAAADPVGVVNAIRSHGCGKLPAVDLPLRSHLQLDEAARRIAGGQSLESAVSKSGYRAKRSASIYVRTRKGEVGISQILVERFCRTVTDSSLQEIGVFQRGEETWMILANPFSPPTPEDARSVTQRVLELINEARSQAHRCGRRKFSATTPLERAGALDQAARVHAEDLAAHGYLGHKGSDGSTPADRAARAGYAWASVAENVAGGQTSAEEAVNTWLDSPGHCANLMSPRYADTGIAYAVNPASENGVYWVQVFGAQK